MITEFASREDLVLGPVIRHVEETTASVWVETGTATDVVLHTDQQSASARTFAVHGHHYALLEVTGLTPGARTPYRIEIGGKQVWPSAQIRELGLPDPVIATMDLERPLQIAFGSCRTSVGHDKEGNDTHGVDALRTYALRMAGLTEPEDGDGLPGDLGWPDLIAFLGDQVYADETTEEMRAFIEARRDIDQAPWTELKDYQEYAHLYRLAWSDPINRWLLSTVPSAMIFDDHDIRDDWNTSAAWKREMEATDWWHDRIVAGLSAYWVYQHLGNLGPAERAEDPIWRRIAAHQSPDELDLTAELDALAVRTDADPTSYRWSYSRDLGGQARLVMVDSRAARVLEPERTLLDEQEMAWLDAQMRGGVDHLLIGTSLPFLLAPGLHNLEACNEVMASGHWGPQVAAVGEKIRRGVDLEHWAAFQDAFTRVSAMVASVAAGERGRAPKTVTFLSGDVHHSYVAEAWRSRTGVEQGMPSLSSRVIQAVCSPIRNPLGRHIRFATAVLSYGVAGPLGRIVSAGAGVPKPPWTWQYSGAPWFDNNLAFLQVVPSGLSMWWVKGEIVDQEHARPRLRLAARFRT